MVLRFLMRYFSNNEQLVNKIADSKPIRRAAQMVVYLLNRTSSLSGSHSLPKDSKEFGQQLFRAAKRLSTELKKEKELQDEMRKRSQK